MQWRQRTKIPRSRRLFKPRRVAPTLRINGKFDLPGSAKPFNLPCCKRSMKPAKEYAILRRKALHRLGRLREVADIGLRSGDFRSADSAAAFVAVEALNTWSNFVRAYV